MSAATILFTDIVGFSRKPTLEQRRFVESLTARVSRELPTLDTPALVALPTGDGLALGFLHEANPPWDRSTLFRVILNLHRWAEDESSPGNRVSLRVGLHVGAVEFITDINGRVNICGDTINYAQRVMDAASPRQTLLSEAAFREYVGAETTVLNTDPFSANLSAYVRGPIEVYAKHGLHMLVYKMTLQPAQSYWANEDPVAKHLMLVKLTPLPKEVVGSFSDRIEQSTQIAFVQLTGDRFIANFEDSKIRLSEELKRFWVFMPDPRIYASLHLTEPQAMPQLVEECAGKWRELLAGVQAQYPNADVRLGLFKEPPYFGASFIDWERPGGRIHVSPYIWNLAAVDCPGYDLEWLGTKPSTVYEAYVEGLQYLRRSTDNSLEK